jgi:hypothetical protein
MSRSSLVGHLIADAVLARDLRRSRTVLIAPFACTLMLASLAAEVGFVTLPN